MEASEKRYWQDKAAQLDPAAYVFRSKAVLGAAFSETVPSGECWYIANAFFCRVSGGDAIYVHRSPDVDKAVPIGAGTKLEFHTSSSYSMHYTCRPAIVIATDERYTTDPKGLYFERLAKLASLPAVSHRVQIQDGAAYGSNYDQPFPDDFEGGLCTSYSNHDVSWGGMASQYGAMNLGSEISDDHQNRIGERVMFPFSRSIFPKLRARGSSVSGAAGVAYMKGNAQITYVKLPSDW